MLTKVPLGFGLVFFGFLFFTIHSPVFFNSLMHLKFVLTFPNCWVPWRRFTVPRTKKLLSKVLHIKTSAPINLLNVLKMFSDLLAVLRKQAVPAEIPYMILQYQCYAVTFQGLFYCIPVWSDIPAPDNIQSV